MMVGKRFRGCGQVSDCDRGYVLFALVEIGRTVHLRRVNCTECKFYLNVPNLFFVCLKRETSKTYPVTCVNFI